MALAPPLKTEVTLGEPLELSETHSFSIFYKIEL